MRRLWVCFSVLRLLFRWRFCCCLAVAMVLKVANLLECQSLCSFLACRRSSAVAVRLIQECVAAMSQSSTVASMLAARVCRRRKGIVVL